MPVVWTGYGAAAYRRCAGWLARSRVVTRLLR